MDYYHFTLYGGVVHLSQDKADEKMQRIAPNWSKYKTEWGTLYYAEYNWYGEIVDGEYRTFPPRLKNGTRVPMNTAVQDFFKEDMLGDCFLMTSKEKDDEVRTAIMRSRLTYSSAIA